MRSGSFSISLGALPFLLLILVIGAAPVGSALVNSLFQDDIEGRFFVGLQNFRALLDDSGFAFSYRITVLWALLNTLLSLVLGFTVAILLKGRFRLFYGILLVPWLIPLYILVPLWRVLLHGSGGASLLYSVFHISINLLTDPLASFFSALFLSVWLSTPLCALVLYAALSRIPRQHEEAAQSEGAGKSQIALCIYLPQLRNTLLTLGVLLFLRAMKEFNLVFLLTSGGPPLLAGFTEKSIIGATTTLGIYLYNILDWSFDLGIPSAFSTLMIATAGLIMAVWLQVQKDKKNHRWILLIIAISQGIFGGILGIFWGIGYLLSLRWRRLFIFIFIVQLVGDGLRMINTGFLNGFNPGIVVSLFGFLLLIKPTKMQLFTGRRGLASIFVFGKWIVAGFLVVASAFSLFLVLWVSISRVDSLSISTILPKPATLSNFVHVFRSEHILRNFFNTLLIASLAGVCTLAVCFPAANWLKNLPPKSTNGILVGVQSITLITGIHTLVPLYWIFRSVGLTNSYIPIVLISCGQSAPVAIFILLAFLRTLPQTYRDYCQLEGVSKRSYLVQILLPLSLPTVIVVAMIAFLNAWNAFLVPLLFLSDETKYTIGVKLFSFVGTLGSAIPQWGYFAATSIVNICIVAGIFIPLRRGLLRNLFYEHVD